VPPITIWGAAVSKDIPAKAGLSNPYCGTGANAVDYNNDGYTDLLITTTAAIIARGHHCSCTVDPRRADPVFAPVKA
jgi:hypothetical protein